MFLSSKDIGEKEFTADTASLRRIRHELPIGQSVSVSTPYWRKPTDELIARAIKMGLKLIKNEDKLGSYKISRIQ